MDYFWVQQDDLPAGIGYGIFSGQHFAALAVCAVVLVLLLWRLRRLPERSQQMAVRVIPFVMLALEIWKDLFLVHVGRFNVGYLPLHLCSLGLFIFLAYSIASWRAGASEAGVSGAALPVRGLRAFLGEIAFCLIMPGSAAALIFPDWAPLYPMWNFINLYGYVWHVLLIAFPMLLFLRGEIRPQIRHLWWNLAFLGVVAIPIYLFDCAYNCNYLFLRWPVEGPLQLISDLLGYPGYLAGYAVLVVVVLLVVYGCIGLVCKVRR